jgi:integrase
MATIRKTSSGRFRAILRDRDGRHLESKTFTLKGDAREWAKRMEADKERMIALGTAGARLTLADIIDVYQRDWDGRDQSRGGRCAWWTAKFGKRRLVDITPIDIRHALDDYADGYALRGDGIGEDLKPKVKATGRKRAPASVNRMKATLSAIWQFAIRKGWATTNPVRGIPQRQEHNKRVRWLSEKEREALLKQTKSSAWERLHLLVLTALGTGCRLGEALSLTWEAIDFKARTARLVRTKNGDSRTLTLPRPVIAELLRHRVDADGKRATGPVFPRQDFRPFWEEAKTAAGIENLRFHDLRHDAASQLVMNGATLHEVAEVLGHRSVQTSQRYAHLSVEHKKALTDKVLGKKLRATGKAENGGAA